jgi:hypothetical protein
MAGPPLLQSLCFYVIAGVKVCMIKHNLKDQNIVNEQGIIGFSLKKHSTTSTFKQGINRAQ